MTWLRALLGVAVTWFHDLAPDSDGERPARPRTATIRIGIALAEASRLIRHHRSVADEAEIRVTLALHRDRDRLLHAFEIAIVVPDDHAVRRHHLKRFQRVAGHDRRVVATIDEDELDLAAIGGDIEF